MSQLERVVKQFTELAPAYASAPHIQDTQALELLLTAVGANPNDSSLDVACGTGSVVCHFASTVRHATGIDVTPAMLTSARELQQSHGLNNVSWQTGDGNDLPYPRGHFSIVTCRYALHHFDHPSRVLAEMVRVCKLGGRVGVVDLAVSESPEEAERFNKLEKLHDPSHVRALPLSQHLDLFARASLPLPQVIRYNIDFTLSRLQRALVSTPERAVAAETLIRNSLKGDSLGTNTRETDGELVFSYPVAIICSTVVKP